MNRRTSYREFLKSSFWQDISKSCKDRDGGKCVRCDSDDTIQAHHIEYPNNWWNTTLDMLETLCRKCHRIEHGIGPTDFQMQFRKIKRHVNLFDTKPPVQDWKELKASMSTPDDLWDFGDLMFMYVSHSWSHIQEGFKKDWWMDPEKSRFWFLRAYNIRHKIQTRAIRRRNAITTPTPRNTT